MRDRKAPAPSAGATLFRISYSSLGALDETSSPSCIPPDIVSRPADFLELTRPQLALRVGR